MELYSYINDDEFTASKFVFFFIETKHQKIGVLHCLFKAAEKKLKILCYNSENKRNGALNQWIYWRKKIEKEKLR